MPISYSEIWLKHAETPLITLLQDYIDTAILCLGASQDRIHVSVPRLSNSILDVLMDLYSEAGWDVKYAGDEQRTGEYVYWFILAKPEEEAEKAAE